MRLWPIELLEYLPQKQLQSQWRELNSIYKKQNKHILINYVYNYPKEYLYAYSEAVINEITKRNIKIRKWLTFNIYFQRIDVDSADLNLRFLEHDKEYLNICYYNLLEKYIRGQKDFTDDVFKKLHEFYKNKIN